MTPSQVGERAEAAVIDALVQTGCAVYDEFIAVYCHDLRSAFLVPVDRLPLRGGHLRLKPTRNRQQRNIRWAEQFRLDWSPPALDEEFTVEAPADPNAPPYR